MTSPWSAAGRDAARAARRSGREVGAGPLTAVRRVVVPLAVLAALVLVPRLARHARRLLLGPGQPGQPAAPRPLPRLRRSCALVRPPLRLHGPALVRPRAVLRDRRLRLQHRPDALGVVVLAGAPAHRRGGAGRAARPRLDQPARHRDRLRHGHARVRAGGERPRAQEPRQADGRGRGARASASRRTSRARSSASSTRRTCTGWRSATRRRCSRSRPGRSPPRRAASGRRSARTSCACRYSACARSGSSCWCSSSRRSSPPRAGWFTCC